MEFHDLPYGICVDTQSDIKVDWCKKKIKKKNNEYKRIYNNTGNVNRRYFY